MDLVGQTLLIHTYFEVIDLLETLDQVKSKVTPYVIRSNKERLILPQNLGIIPMKKKITQYIGISSVQSIQWNLQEIVIQIHGNQQKSWPQPGKL